MMKKYRTILLATMAAVLTACGGGKDDSSSKNQGAAKDAPTTPEATSTDAGAMGGELPDGVTMALVEEGKSIFTGRGICMTCHGPDGTGVPNLGGNLTDMNWIHSDGSYEGIVQTIMDGVSVDASTVGTPMPPKGGSGISDEQVKAVAAYVWTLSN